LILKAGPYDGMCDGFYSEIVRYCQAIDKPYLKKKIDSIMVLPISIYTHARTSCIMCPFRVRSRRQWSNSAVWNETQYLLNLAHMCGLTFGNLKAPTVSCSFHDIPLIGQITPLKANAVVIQNIYRRLLVPKLELT
jgi:hypothetical protein